MYCLESPPRLISGLILHRQGLDDTDAARLGHGGDELRVRAREHGAADQRHGDTRVAGERRVEPPRPPPPPRGPRPGGRGGPAAPPPAAPAAAPPPPRPDSRHRQ